MLLLILTIVILKILSHTYGDTSASNARCTNSIHGSLQRRGVVCWIIWTIIYTGGVCCTSWGLGNLRRTNRRLFSEDFVAPCNAGDAREPKIQTGTQWPILHRDLLTTKEKREITQRWHGTPRSIPNP